MGENATELHQVTLDKIIEAWHLTHPGDEFRAGLLGLFLMHIGLAVPDSNEIKAPVDEPLKALIKALKSVQDTQRESLNFSKEIYAKAMQLSDAVLSLHTRMNLLESKGEPKH